MKHVFVISFLLLTTTIFATDYYWVGGSGNWADIRHWATTSGGSSNHSQTPTANDDVYFDGNSFTANGQAVTLNAVIANCRNLDWTGAAFSPRFNAPDINTQFQIYGSVKLIPSIVFSFAGDVILQTPDANVNIDFLNHDLGRNIIFNGSGSWDLLNKITVSNEFNLKKGTLNLGNTEINSQYFFSKTDESRIINFENSKINITGGSYHPYNLESNINYFSLQIHGQNFTSTGGTSIIDISHPEGEVYMYEGGILQLGTLIFSNSGGLSSITNFNGQTNFSLTKDLDLRHNTFVLAEFDFDQLILEPGFIYKFQENGSYNIGGIIASGNCTKNTFLTSIIGGDPVSFTTANSFTIDFITLRDIQISGTIAIANNAVDLGNNTGFTLSSKSSETFYWVGGSGDWSDGSHWAFTSGGAGSGCIPTAVDDVYFDDMSFSANNQTVTVDSDIAFAKDFLWNNVRSGSTFIGTPEKIIFVNGGSTFDGNMTNEFIGQFHYISNQSANSITSNGIPFANDILFDNQDGSWIVEDDLFVQNFIYHVSGELTFLDVEVNAIRYYSDFTNTRILNLEASTLTLTARPDDGNYDSPEFIVIPDNYTLNAGTSKIIFENNSYGGYLSIRAENSGEIVFYDIEFRTIYGTFEVWPWSDATFRVHHLTYRQNGDIYGNGTLENLELEPSFVCYFRNNIEIDIDNLIGQGGCDGFITMQASDYLWVKPILKFSANQDLIGYDIKNLDAQSPSGVVNCIDSKDSGNNTGWSFDERTTRTLFWVHNTNLWQDEANWSLTSGGMGGECIPTIIDDVVFDENSFPLKTESVNWSTTYFCHNFDFNVVGFNGAFYGDILRAAGDVRIHQKLNGSVGSLELVGDQFEQKLFIEDFHVGNLSINGSSRAVVEKDLVISYSISMSNGSLVATDFNITANQLYMNGSLHDPILLLTRSTLEIKGESYYPNNNVFISENAEVYAQNGTLQFTSVASSMEVLTREARFGKILFSNINGEGTIRMNDDVDVRNLEFQGNGYIYESYTSAPNASFVIDSLILASGHFYEIESEMVLGIFGLLQARGNNCSPISLKSTSEGNKAIISMPSIARTNMDFVEMQDIQGIGGFDYNAGPHSTDINNSNVNWTFPELSIDNDIGVLGPDKFICDGMDLNLNAFSYTPNESYLWDNGNKDSIQVVDTPGKYFVEINFENNCVITDTIEIFDAQSFENFLPQDTVVCDDGIFMADVKIVNPDITYLWNDGSMESQLDINQSGEYAVTITLDGCAFSDSLDVSYIDIDLGDFDLGEDIRACEGEEINLSVSVPDADLTWSDGSMGSELKVTVSGEYSILVTKDVCSVGDTVNIVFNTPPVFELGEDTSFCESLIITIEVDDIGVPITWQDGSVANSFDPIEEGFVVAEADNNGCIFRDSLFVKMKPLPVFSLGKDTTLCNDAQLHLRVPEETTKNEWIKNGDKAGENTIEFLVTESGMYAALLDVDGCVGFDEIMVNYVQLQKPDLGLDTIICEGEFLEIQTLVNNNDNVLWSTGSMEKMITVSEEDTYIVTAVNDVCMLFDTINIEVAPAPTTNLKETYFLCPDENLTIEGEGSFDEFVWDGQAFGSALITPIPGIFRYSTMLGLCSIEGEIEVLDVVFPEIDLGQDLEVCIGETLVIGIQDVEGFNPVWQDGRESFTYEVRSEGSYSLTLGVEGCSVTDSVFVEGRTCNNQVLFFPNILNPNSSANNLFAPKVNPDFFIITYRISIFDRWGNQVYSSESMDEGWNGLMNNNSLSTGVYTYISEYEYGGRKEGKEVFPGNVTVVH